MGDNAPIDDLRVAAAIEAAERAGEIQRDARGSPADAVDYEYKDDAGRDLVTEVDRASEREILDVLGERFPDHAVLAEESGEVGASGDAAARWIVDPLDGTTNYFHGVPHYGSSIALAVDGRLAVGVVHHTPTGETYAAARGAGAFHDGEPLSVSGTRELGRALVATGFGHGGASPADADLMRSVIDASHGIRRLGSAATDLALVAAGRFDAFYHRSLHTWDVAAGSLLVSEAGGEATAISGEPPTDDGPFVASNGRVGDDLRAIIE